MKLISPHIQAKALFLLGVVVWLMSFQVYHRIVEHGSGNADSAHCHGHAHCHTHSHDSEALPFSYQATDAQHHDVDCEVCKLISIPFDAPLAFEWMAPHIFEQKELSYWYQYTQSFELYQVRNHRGPPSIWG